MMRYCSNNKPGKTRKSSARTTHAPCVYAYTYICIRGVCKRWGDGTNCGRGREKETPVKTEIDPCRLGALLNRETALELYNSHSRLRRWRLPQTSKTNRSKISHILRWAGGNFPRALRSFQAKHISPIRRTWYMHFNVAERGRIWCIRC